jgi:hypothetical protein
LRYAGLSCQKGVASADVSDAAVMGRAMGWVMPKSRSKRRQQPIPDRKIIPPAPSVQMQLSLGYDPKGPMEQRDVVHSKDGWSEYTLDDGSIIRLKAVILDVKKAVGQYNLEGDPVYVMQQTIVTNLKAPDDLKKKDK